MASAISFWVQPKVSILKAIPGNVSARWQFSQSHEMQRECTLRRPYKFDRL